MMLPEVPQVSQSADLPASVQADTVVPGAEVIPPEVVDPPAPSKVFTQAEVDAIVGKRLAKEERKWKREQGDAAPAPKADDGAPLKLEDFATPEDYAEALAERRAAVIVQGREEQQQTAQLEEAYHEQEDKAREKYDDFEQVAYNPKLPVTEAMAKAIRASDVGPDILYTLGLDPKEAARISKLPVFLQVKEIGKIEGKLSTTPPAPKKTTSAPAPIKPVNAAAARPGANEAGGYETTDPRSIATMNTSQWIEAERQRQIKKAQAQARTH